MDIEQFNLLSQEHRVCKSCGHVMMIVDTGQKFEEAEPVRCPACFQVFVPYLKMP